VREALQSCCAHRVGHGTRLIEYPSLMNYVADRGIPIEICLTSNVQTRVASSYGAHPLRRYFDEGIKVTLNTDNRLMSATTLTDEYAHAATDLGFTFDELARLAMNGFETAFLPRGQRARLAQRAAAAIAALRGKRGG
jgi:adenosine deaminase